MTAVVGLNNVSHRPTRWSAFEIGWHSTVASRLRRVVYCLARSIFVGSIGLCERTGGRLRPRRVDPDNQIAEMPMEFRPSTSAGGYAKGESIAIVEGLENPFLMSEPSGLRHSCYFGESHTDQIHRHTG